MFEVGKAYKTEVGYRHVVATLPDGRLVVMGGLGDLSAWLYKPNGEHPLGHQEKDLIPPRNVVVSDAVAEAYRTCYACGESHSESLKAAITAYLDENEMWDDIDG